MTVSNTAGTKDRWRRQIESVRDDSELDHEGLDGATKAVCLPPPPLINGMQPDGRHSRSARPSELPSKPASRHTGEYQHQPPARAEPVRSYTEQTQSAPVAAASSALPPAKQVPAERGASHKLSQAKQKGPEALLGGSQEAGGRNAAPALGLVPTADAAAPIHSPLGPPVPGKSVDLFTEPLHPISSSLLSCPSNLHPTRVSGDLMMTFFVCNNIWTACISRSGGAALAAPHHLLQHMLPLTGPHPLIRLCITPILMTQCCNCRRGGGTITGRLLTAGSSPKGEAC